MHELSLRERNVRAVTHDGICDVWACTCDRLYEGEPGGPPPDLGREHVFSELRLHKTCVTDEHTCDTLADECKACEATELLKSLP
jgi:hypothetical protein